MRLGIVSTFPPYRGGIAQFNAAMCKALEAKGHQVKCVTWARQYPKFLFPGKTQWEPGKDLGDATMPAVLDSVRPFTWKETGRYFSDVELLILPFWHAALAPALAGVARSARSNHGPRIWALMHNASSHDGSPIHRFLSQSFLRQVDHVVTLSEPVSAALHTWNPSTLFHPLYDHFGPAPSVSESRRQLGLTESDTVHLFFGLIRPYKGLDVLIRALALLPTEHKLVIAGECYGTWDVYADLIEQLGLKDRVELHIEFIEDKLVPLYFKAADHVVLPYKEASQSGVTALALHHEVKVVASDVGDLRKTVVPELTGRLVHPNSPEDLALAMSQPWTAQYVDVQGAFAKVKARLSWSAWADQLMQLVEPARAEAPHEGE